MSGGENLCRLLNQGEGGSNRGFGVPFAYRKVRSPSYAIHALLDVLNPLDHADADILVWQRFQNVPKWEVRRHALDANAATRRYPVLIRPVPDDPFIIHKAGKISKHSTICGFSPC